MLKKALFVISGNAAGSLLLLVRNLVVARLVSPDDYGIASTFAIGMSIVEMLSYLGLQQLIIVERDGDEPHVQAAMQGFQVLRGLLSAILMYLIAYPYAAFLGIPQVTWAFEILALLPLINALQHFDTHRLRRHMIFGPSVLSSSVPALASVLTLWPLALLFHDYRIMLVSLFIQAGTMVLLSHITARRPYQLALDPALMKRAVRFGWPLLANGLLLFAIFNGEKLIVGRELGMVQLAYFGMAFTLTLTPTLVLANSIQSIFLPQLGRVRDDDAGFQRIGVATMEASLSVALALVMATALVGGPVVALLVGPKYYETLTILVPLAVMQGARVLKSGAAVIGLAKSHPGNAMIANLIRVGSLPIAWAVVHYTGDLFTVIWIGTAAELAGYAVALYLVRRKAGLRLRPLAVPILLTAAAGAAATVVAMIWPPQVRLADNAHWAQLAIVLPGLAAFWSMTSLRRYIRQVVARRRAR